MTPHVLAIWIQFNTDNFAAYDDVRGHECFN